jgi:DNA-directed RNA polymerase sigma subunit (sigma70/sigma32)
MALPSLCFSPHTRPQDESQETDEDVLIEGCMTMDIEKVLGLLTLREANILRMRYGLPMNGSVAEHRRTLQHIGDVYNVSKERIRQIEGKALQTLRDLRQKHDLQLDHYGKIHKRERLISAQNKRQLCSLCNK